MTTPNTPHFYGRAEAPSLHIVLAQVHDLFYQLDKVNQENYYGLLSLGKDVQTLKVSVSLKNIAIMLNLKPCFTCIPTSRAMTNF
jgi:hypothetical protein